VQYLIIANNGYRKQKVTRCCVTQKVSHIPWKTAILAPSNNKGGRTLGNEDNQPTSFPINLLLYFLVPNSEPYSCHSRYIIRILREILPVKSLTNTVCTSERTQCSSGLHNLLRGPGQRLATGCTVRGSNPVGGMGEIFRTRPDRPWGPPSLLYNGYRVFSGVKRPGSGVDDPLHLTPRLKKEYSYTYTPPLDLRSLLWSELYLYLYNLLLSVENWTVFS